MSGVAGRVVSENSGQIGGATIDIERFERQLHLSDSGNFFRIMDMGDYDFTASAEGECIQFQYLIKPMSLISMFPYLGVFHNPSRRVLYLKMFMFTFYFRLWQSNKVGVCPGRYHTPSHLLPAEGGLLSKIPRLRVHGEETESPCRNLYSHHQTLQVYKLEV